MPTAVEEPKSETATTETVSERTKAYAAKVEEQLKELASTLGPQYWKMAELIWAVKDKNIWQILGYESEQHYREHLFIPRSTWFERRRLWGDWARIALQDEKITRSRLHRMPSQNVKQLMRLVDKRMFQDKWIEWALNLTEEELTAKVDHVLENDAEPEDDVTPESGAILKLRCTAGQKSMILDTVHEFLRRQGMPIDEEARGLELALADWKGGWPESGPVINE